MKIIGSHIHYGNYGRLMQVDEDGNEIELKVEVEKRGRGRPKKAVNATQMEWTPLLDKAMFAWVLRSTKNAK